MVYNGKNLELRGLMFLFEMTNHVPLGKSIFSGLSFPYLYNEEIEHDLLTVSSVALWKYTHRTSWIFILNAFNKV